MRSAVREESFNSVKVFWLDTKLVLDRIRVRVRRLEGDPRIIKVVLFGSLPEGRAVPGSDADILIILDQDGRSISDRIPEFSEFFSDIGIGVDVFPYTRDELDNPVARTALSRGVVLFSRE